MFIKLISHLCLLFLVLPDNNHVSLVTPTERNKVLLYYLMFILDFVNIVT